MTSKERLKTLSGTPEGKMNSRKRDNIQRGMQEGRKRLGKG
jgi:hypothetical protein